MRTPWISYAEIMARHQSSTRKDEWRWPYDLPDACRFSRLANGRVLIEYQYLDGVEDHNRKHDFGDVILYEGDHTSRILAIDIDVRKHLSPDIQQQLAESIARLAEPPQYQANRMIVRDSLPAVMEESRKMVGAQ